MKQFLFYISFIVAAWACQQDRIEEMTGIAPDGEGDKIRVNFMTQFPSDVQYGTDIIPMKSSTLDTIKTIIRNYRAIFIKWTGEKWIVDTIVHGRYGQSIIRKGVQLPSLSVTLRPGEYKVGLFLNGEQTLIYMKQLKPGSFVSDSYEIQKGDILPPAYKLTKAEGLTHFVFHEIFAGSANFTVGKNDHLLPDGANSPIRIPVARKVSLFRYLLKEHLPKDSLGDKDFHDTQYTFTADLTTTAATPFCDGLDVLGRPRYGIDSTYTTLNIYCSEGGNRFLSKFDNRVYHLCCPAPTGLWPGLSGPSKPFLYVLIDDTKPKGIPVELKNILITGQSGGGYPQYDLDSTIHLTLKPNATLQTIYEMKGLKDFEDGDQPTYHLRYVVDEKADSLFPTFYELNPTTLIP